MPPIQAPPSEAVRYVLVRVEANCLSHFVLRPSALHVLGRADESDIVLNDPSVSRKHAVVFGSSPPTIKDLDSRNGTKVGSRAIPPGTFVPIDVGSAVQLGDVVLRLELASGAQVSLPPTRASLGPDSSASPPPPSIHTRGVDLDPDEMVSEDPQTQELLNQATVMAKSDLTVLITGETGVGKERLAQVIYARSSRSSRPLIAINCAAFPESMIESELFGYERGAFTGAQKSKRGLIAAADGGTLFLDEVGELTLPVQAKLLRVLEAREFLPLGALKPTRVDIRIIAATNRNLKDEIARGTFRQDLYYRLSGLVLAIPPLRARKNELIALASRFASRFATTLGRAAPQLSEEACQAMLAHSWPGNVRELKNAVERAVLLSSGGVIGAREILQAEEPPPTSRSLGTAATAVREISEPLPVTGRRRVVDPEAIRRALHMAGGDQRAAAKALGVSRRTLINWLDKFNLPRPRKVVRQSH